MVSDNLQYLLQGMENRGCLELTLRALKKDAVQNAGRGRILVPNLEVLHVICKQLSGLRKTFLNVVRSRSGSPDGSRSDVVARLRSVSLQNGENKQLKRQGSDVTILDGPLNDEDADWVYGGQTETAFDSDNWDYSDGWDDSDDDSDDSD
jgi:hypothetical protein